MTEVELVDAVAMLLVRAGEAGHAHADLADLMLGVALRYYAAAGFSPGEARALLLSRLRSVAPGGNWNVSS